MRFGWVSNCNRDYNDRSVACTAAKHSSAKFTAGIRIIILPKIKSSRVLPPLCTGQFWVRKILRKIRYDLNIKIVMTFEKPILKVYLMDTVPVRAIFLWDIIS